MVDESPIVTIPTSEGPAYHPFGSWGRGYILDVPTRGTMATYTRWCVWIAMPLWPISNSVGDGIGVDHLVSGFGGWLVFCAIHSIAKLYILRDCRTTSRAKAEDLLRHEIEQRGHLAVESMRWCGVIVSACATALAGLTLNGLERWVFTAIFLAWVVVAAAQLWRIKRLDAPEPQSPASRP